MKRLVLPYFCPLSPDTDADKLAKGIAGYLAFEGVEGTAALPVAIGILAAVQTFALRGADAACMELEKRAAPRRQNIPLCLTSKLKKEKDDGKRK